MRLYELFKRQPVDHSLPFDDHEEPDRKDDLKLRDELWRGPHEGRYLQLFLAGKKPAILLQDYEMGPFQKYVDNGQLAQLEIDVFSNSKSFVLTVPGEGWRANQLKKLFQKAIADDYWETQNERVWHAKVGLLLGYTNTDIRQFLNAEIPHR